MPDIHQYLEQLSVSDRDLRRAALEQVLAREDFRPLVQAEEKTEENPRPTQNYLLLPEEGEPFPLFCAHYDSYHGSEGANDNAAALCILIALAKELKAQGVRAGFAFFDGEEDGHLGAKLFAAMRGELALSAVINLDICGYGDTVAVCSKGSPRKRGIRAFCDAKRLKAHNGRLVQFLPESDDACFRTWQQPVLSVAVVPKWDIQYLKALASYGGNILGRPPEYKMMLGQLEVASTMHGAFRDGVKWVQPEAMRQVYGYLLDAVTAPPERSRFSLFRRHNMEEESK